MPGYRIRAPFAAFVALLLAVGPSAWAQTTRISISTGGTGGVYYPLGGGMANVLSKYVPGLQVTAEVTEPTSSRTEKSTSARCWSFIPTACRS